MGFKFQNNLKKFDIEDENGEVLKSYQINVGNEKIIDSLSKKSKEIDDVLKEIEKPGAIEKLRELCAEVINTFLNNEFDIWYKKSGEDVFFMIELVNALVSFVHENTSERFKKYGV